MQAEHYDYIVIGGGSGGYAAARTARETLSRVAIVDGSETLGGLCILRGCMPSKTLIYSAEVLHLAQMGHQFGLYIPEAKADMTALHQRKLEIIKEFADYRQEQLQSDRFTLFRSHARFIDSNTIVLSDGQKLTADHFMIATGSIISEPPIKGLSDIDYWTSDDVLELDFVPEKVIVLGGGIVACELAQLLKRIGAQVIQIQRGSQILKEVSKSAAEVIEEQFRAEGIHLYTDTQIEEILKTDSEIAVKFAHQGENIEIKAPYLMNALGRKPATKGLNLEAANVETRADGKIHCSDLQQTSNPKIYACGDVTGPHEIVHTAIMQGELAARHATGRPAKPINYDTLLSVVFTDPQIGVVGLSEKELKKRGVDYVSADYPFDDHGKSMLMEIKRGYVKIFAEKATGTVLGAECVCRDGGELIHTLAVAVSLAATAEELLKVHWYHPTLSEIWSYPLEEIVDEING